MEKSKRTETLVIIFVISVGLIGLIFGLYSFFAISKTAGYVSLLDKPIHWHPHLEIVIKGEKVVVPANIGMGTSYSNSPFYDPMMDMTNMHTHDDSGTLHWEVMMNAPTREDLYLGNFFQVWEKTFNGNCIFEFCDGPEGSVKMFVNGKLDNDFENYIVGDGDKIRIVYE